MFVAKRLPKPTDTQALGTIIPVPLQAKCPCSVHSIKWMSTPPQECTRPVSTIRSAHTGPGSRHPPPLRWLANGHDLVLIESLHCKPIQSLVSTVETHKTVREAYSYTQGPLVPFPERLAEPLSQSWSPWKIKPLLQTCYTEKPSGRACSSISNLHGTGLGQGFCSLAAWAPISRLLLMASGT